MAMTAWETRSTKLSAKLACTRLKGRILDVQLRSNLAGNPRMAEIVPAPALVSPAG